MERNVNDRLETGFFVHRRIISVGKDAIFSDRLSCIMLKSWGFDIIVLNVRGLYMPLRKILQIRYYNKDSFYEEIDLLFDQLPVSVRRF